MSKTSTLTALVALALGTTCLQTNIASARASNGKRRQCARTAAHHRHSNIFSHRFQQRQQHAHKFSDGQRAEFAR